MSDQSTPAEDGTPPRDHPQDPAEGADGATVEEGPRVHAQDPAEGADDDSATD